MLTSELHSYQTGVQQLAQESRKLDFPGEVLEEISEDNNNIGG